MLKVPRHGFHASPFRGRQALDRLRLMSVNQLEAVERRDTLFRWCRTCRRDTRQVVVDAHTEGVGVHWCYCCQGEPPAAVTL